MRTLLITLLLCSSAMAQDTVVTDSQIKVGSMLTCPRFSALYTNKLVVPAETTATLPARFDYDAIEVSGTLKLSREYDTSGKFIVIQVLPGGSLDFGSSSDPVLRKVDLVIKDSPLLTGTDGNLGPDPEQFGSGILVFGEWKSWGRKLDKTWTQMQPVAAGATTLTLSTPVNWQVGDELLIPDTRLAYDVANIIALPPQPIRRESPVRIAAISGSTLTLDKPLDFEHLSVSGHLPYVANCTRNLVIRSENPAGVRGHCMFMGTAHVNLYYTSFIGLGRTQAKTLDSFNSNTSHIGTNQIARYAVHWHHVHGHADAQGYTGRMVGCYLDGLDGNKWGQVQHGTHDLLIADNVAQRFVGACYVSAEDGNEVRGQYLRNFSAYAKGNGFNGKQNARVDVQNAPGSEGAGIWGKGSGSTFRDNVSMNCQAGYSFVHIDQVSPRLVPSVPGGMNDTLLDPARTVPVDFSRQVAIANGIGLETWRLDGGWTADGFTARNNHIGILMGPGEPGNLRVTNASIFNDTITTLGYKLIVADADDTIGISSSSAYTSSLELDGVTIDGYSEAVHDAINYSIRNSYLRGRNYTLRWDTDAHHYTTADKPTEWHLDNTLLEGARPDTKLLAFGQGGLDQLAAGNIPVKLTVTNWQRSGKNYQFYENAFSPANAVALDGLVNAKAVETGVAPPPPPPPPPPPLTLEQRVEDLERRVKALEAVK